MNPFELFPIGVWELTGDKLDDSNDAVAFLQALPKLDITINKRKRYWLIGEILPFLHGLISEEDFLKLRLICKQWKVKIDSFLANQPYFQAYSHQLHRDRHNFWDFLSVEIENKNVLEFRYDYSLWTMEYPIYENWMALPSTQHPFMCRKLGLLPFAEDQDRNLLMEQILNILTRFGTHLWYLEFCSFLSESFSLENVTLRDEQIANVVKMLEKTPNLRSLKFYKSIWHVDEVSDKPLLQIELPELPFLESLDINIKKSELINDEFIWLLLKRYGPQIRRLKLQMRHWKVQVFKELFTQLTELDIIDHDQNHEKHFLQIKTTLSTFSACNLARIKLKFSYIVPVQLSVEEDILKWLKRFPLIKYFELTSDMLYVGKIVLKEEGTSDPSTDLVPSLETLKIMGSRGLSYNFLRCFPYLRHLELRFRPKFEEDIKTSQVYKSDLWNCLELEFY